MAKELIIKTPAGYVIGYDYEYMIVQVTDDIQKAKKFTNYNIVSFVSTYADAGYGLSKKNMTILDAPR